MEPNNDLIDKGLLGANCLVTSLHHKALLQLINPTDEKVILNKNDVVATIAEVDKNEIHDWSNNMNESKLYVNNVEKTRKNNKPDLKIDLSKSDLNAQQKQKLMNLVNKNRKVFANMSEIGLKMFIFMK